MALDPQARIALQQTQVLYTTKPLNLSISISHTPSSLTQCLDLSLDLLLSIAYRKALNCRFTKQHHLCPLPISVCNLRDAAKRYNPRQDFPY